jgi:hypothetical protein
MLDVVEIGLDDLILDEVGRMLDCCVIIEIQDVDVVVEETAIGSLRVLEGIDCVERESKVTGFLGEMQEMRDSVSESVLSLSDVVFVEHNSDDARAGDYELEDC